MIVWIIYRIFITTFMVIAGNELVNGHNSAGVEFSLGLLIIVLFERLYISIRLSHG